MTDSTGELMKSYEVITSIVARHSQYDAAMILTLNLASCITVGFPRWYRRRQRPTALLFRLTYRSASGNAARTARTAGCFTTAAAAFSVSAFVIA
jgi:hypothetical protein